MKLKKKLHNTFFANSYILDKFLEKEFLQLDKSENSSWEFKSLTAYFHYSKENEEFKEFANWASDKLQTREFLDKANRFVEIKQQLKTEPVGQKRSELVKELSRIEYE